jgi:hypothetical protein
VAIDVLVFTATVCAHSTETIRVNGDVFALTGTCGAKITTTSVLGGSGVVTNGSVATSIGCERTSVGLAQSGFVSVLIGTSTARTTTTIACTVAPSGVGVATGALACTCIDTASCTEITRAIGDEFVRTGISGGIIITTSDLVGRGDGIVALADIYTECASTIGGLALGGLWCEGTGI